MPSGFDMGPARVVGTGRRVANGTVPCEAQFVRQAQAPVAFHAPVLRLRTFRKKRFAHIAVAERPCAGATNHINDRGVLQQAGSWCGNWCNSASTATEIERDSSSEVQNLVLGTSGKINMQFELDEHFRKLRCGEPHFGVPRPPNLFESQHALADLVPPVDAAKYFPVPVQQLRLRYQLFARLVDLVAETLDTEVARPHAASCGDEELRWFRTRVPVCYCKHRHSVAAAPLHISAHGETGASSVPFQQGRELGFGEPNGWE